MIISYSLVDNEHDDNDNDDTSSHREKRNAVKGNLNIVNKFARQEEVRSGGSKGTPGTPLPVQILSFSIFSIVQNNSLVHPSEILDPPLVVTN